MKQELLSAIQEHDYWLERFARRTYFEAFKEYTVRFGTAYMDAVREAGDEAGLQALADELLTALEEKWARTHFWKRTRARYDDKQMLVGYLSPLLLGLEEPGCGRLAELLRDGWTARCPKEGYELATYKTIRGGFRNVILGMEFKDNLRELEEEMEP